MPLVRIGARSRVIGVSARALVPTARSNIGTLGDNASRGTTGTRVSSIASEMLGTLQTVEFLLAHMPPLFR